MYSKKVIVKISRKILNNQKEYRKGKIGIKSKEN